ncbi:MAG TPA: L-threonylcarbamoyladenylate synthase [Thermoanaerobaculia bacterium]|nr:L-threonylcarbamoyladenylate synthase [Thermoanaerobaculia bacterium]
MTRRWQIADAPSTLQLNEIAKVLMSGSVVLMPTDTIYGLHALATNEDAVARVADIKGREETKPFIVLASSIEQLEPLGIIAERKTLHALASIWPAPLTAILPLRESIAASRGASTLAVRIPALEWLRELVARTGPLVSTSANRSGERAVDDPNFLARDLQEQLDAVVDGGVRNGEPSAILDLTSGEPHFLREGEESFTQKVWKTLRKTL